MPAAADDVVEVEQPGHDLVRLLHIPRPEIPAVAIHQLVERRHQHYLRLTLQHGDLRCQPPRHHDVVAVESRHVLRPRMAQPQVRRFGDAEVSRGRDDDDARVPRRPSAQHLRRAVGRAVVDDHELEVTEILREDALNRLAHERLAVEDRHEHGDARSH